MSTKERREREKRQRRESILRAALEVIKEEGYSGLSIDKVAEKAELSKGAIYLYFESKENLIIEVFWMLMGELLEKIKAVIQQIPPGNVEKGIKTLIQAIVDFYCSQQKFFVFMHHTVTGLPDETLKGIRKTALEYNKKVNETIISFFKHIGCEKEFKYPLIETSYALRGIVTQFLIAKFFGGYEKDIDVDMLTDIFLRGALI